jgi:gluconokinase
LRCPGSGYADDMDAVPHPRPLVVVMGVSGSGKSTVARRLAERLGADFAEGDEFHPATNVAKMAAGHPLDDLDRVDWLRRLGDWLAEHEPTGGVLSASALRRSYRDRLRTSAPSTVFLHLHGSPHLLLERMGSRAGHFMPVTLLDSQLATLEPLEDDERGLTVDAAEPTDVTIRHFLRWLE